MQQSLSKVAEANRPETDGHMDNLKIAELLWQTVGDAQGRLQRPEFGESVVQRRVFQRWVREKRPEFRREDFRGWFSEESGLEEVC